MAVGESNASLKQKELLLCSARVTRLSLFGFEHHDDDDDVFIEALFDDIQIYMSFPQAAFFETHQKQCLGLQI